MSLFKSFAGAVALMVVASPVAAETWTVRPEWVAAHENFLASDSLRGRGSATPDEAIAADYVAAQFQGYGLKPAPGMTGYLQTAPVIRPKLAGNAKISGEGFSLAEGAGLTLFVTNAKAHGGKLAVAGSDDPAAMPEGDIVVVANPGKASLRTWTRAAKEKHAQMVIFAESDATRALWPAIGSATRVQSYLEEKPPVMAGADVAVVSPAVLEQLKVQDGKTVSYNPGDVVFTRSVTTNAIGWLEGSDPKAGVILVTAHLDHLGVRPDGVIMHGANDDASGTVAVMEIARALAAGEKPKRSVLFVAYGSEELGGLGSTYFGEHPPVPLESIVANLEFEMIGAQDPKMQPGQLMMTGFDRSNLGETLRARGAAVAPDLYPDQHFFERSDNYSLAVKGIVAHTISGWAVTPTYHDPSDDIAHIDVPFMTAAIQSLIEPVRWLADGGFTPEWKPGGKPQ